MNKQMLQYGGTLLAMAFLCFGTLSPLSAEEAPAGNPPLLKFSVISDIHVQKWDWRSHDKLKRALGDLNAVAPDSQALIVNGDLGDGLSSDYDTLRKLMKNSSHPAKLFYTIGNHEYYKAWHDSKGVWYPNSFPNEETEKASQQRFLEFAGRERIYDDAWVAGYHFILLGSEAYRQSDPSNNEDAWLSEEQLTWLEQTLQVQEQADKPIFVFLHQPFPNTVAGSQTPLNNRGIVQHERLKAILSKHPQVIYFSGHTHWQLSSKNTMVREKFTMVNSSSVYEPYNESDIAYDLDYDWSEGLAVEVYPNHVLVRGRDFSNGTWIPEAQFVIKMN